MTKEVTVRFVNPDELGQLIAQKRHEKGLKQTEVAQALGMTQRAVSEIENGSQGVRIDKVLKLAHGVGLELFARLDA